MTVQLNTDALDELNTTEAVALHSLMDTLGSYGVGNIINLPQIIVVGEQCAGKSSVLEALCRVRFPVAAGVCTRFATEIVLRKASSSSVAVTIQFDGNQKPPKKFSRQSFSEEDMADLIKEAKGHMGLAENHRGFSRDVLRLEIYGPSFYPLTLIDLPGIFHVQTADQSMQGKEVVDQLIDKYMVQKNSIILVVIEANRQIANHIALGRVQAHDPNRDRTLGIITKPDLAPKGSIEASHIQLAQNKEPSHKLRHGWHVLRNRAEDETSLEARDAAEAAFFESSPWGILVECDRGISSLRKKLSTILYNHIRTSLPDVIQDIETQLDERQIALGQLGTERSNNREMRSFLLNIAGEFQRLTRDGINGQYSDSFFGQLNTPANRLRADLKGFHRIFDYYLKTRGQKWRIAPLKGLEPIIPAPSGFFDFLAMHNHVDHSPKPKPMSRPEMNAFLERYASVSEGRELPGAYNSELAIQMFKMQAEPWRAIAISHIEKMLEIAKLFVESLFRHVIGRQNSDPTIEVVLSEFVDPFFEGRGKMLKEKLDELLSPYTDGYAVPLDTEFREMVNTLAIERLAKQLEKLPLYKSEKEADTSVEKMKLDLISAATTLTRSADGGTFGTEKIIDMMEAYYEMSRRTFTDNIINLAVESCLVRHLPTILTPTQVGEMDDEEIKQLANESEDTKSRRIQLSREVTILKQGLDKCRRWRPRAETIKSARSSTTLNPKNASPPKTNSFLNGSSPAFQPATKSILNFNSPVKSIPVSTPVTPHNPFKNTSTAPSPFASTATTTNNTPSLLGGSSASSSFTSPPVSNIFAHLASPNTTEPPSSFRSGGLFGTKPSKDFNAARTATGGLFSLPKTTESTTNNQKT